MRGVVGEGKHNPLTLISYIRSKEISLQTVSQTAEPPALIVFVEDLDDVTAANGELVRTVSVVVVECNNLQSRRNERGGEARPCECQECAASDGVQSRSKASAVAEQSQSLSLDGRLRKCSQGKGSERKRYI